jgi:hypothetical protein
VLSLHDAAAGQTFRTAATSGRMLDATKARLQVSCDDEDFRARTTHLAMRVLYDRYRSDSALMRR